MGKYLKKFDTHSEYSTYINGQDAILPNVSYCVNNKDVHYNPNFSYTVKITYTIPSPSAFNEGHWDWENNEYIMDVEYTEYDLLLINDDVNFRKITINGVDQTTNTYHITESDTDSEIIAYIYMDTTIIPNNSFTGLFYVTGVEFGPQVLEIESVTISDNPLNEYSNGGAFAYCSLNNIVLNNVKKIGHCAFKVSTRVDIYDYIGYKINGSNSITAPTKTAIPLDLSKVIFIGEFAFCGLAIDGDFILNNNIVIYPNAFYSTLIHGTITFPSSYTSINLSIDKYLSYDSDTYIASSVLTNAIDGADVFHFTNNVDEIITFGNFNSQETNTVGILTIPTTVTSITGENVFFDYKNLISLPTTPPTLSNNALKNQKQWNSSTRTFDYIINWSNIYVPDSSVNAYKTASGWSDVASVIKPLSQLS